MESRKFSTWLLFSFLAPVLCAFSGFHGASYLLAGVYTWPRTSRVIVLTVGMLIFAYEFIFKHASPPLASGKIFSRKTWVLYACVIPYMIGAGVLATIAGVSR